MNEAGSLFSGVGLLDYGLHLAGWRHRFFCESDEWRRGILARRWPGVPVHADVRRLSGDAVPRVELLAGGFPCKGGSTSGGRTGLDHPETALWAEFARLAGEIRPRYVLLENVANLLALNGGAVWGAVLGDLAALGYDVWWDVLPAAAFGAPHLRERVFGVAIRSGVAEGPAVAADPGEWRCQGFAAGDGAQSTIVEPDARRLGVPVEWGEYGPAVRRWESLHGSAPEPLCAFRGVDAGRAATLERSRVSALGDGVLVKAGFLLGSMIVDFIHNQERDAA